VGGGGGGGEDGDTLMLPARRLNGQITTQFPINV